MQPMVAAHGCEAEPTSTWMVSPAIDLLLFVGVTLTTIVPWVVSDVLHVPGYYVLIGVAFANGPHLISTWTRVYLPRRERFRRPIHYWLVPGALAAFAIACNTGPGIGPQLVRTVIFYWASWHFAAQSWGILKIYQRKHGAVGTGLGALEKALVFLPAAFCVLRRLYTGPWELFGVEILHPTPRAWMVNGLGALTVTLALVYLAGIVRRGVQPIRPLYLGFSAIGFLVPYLVIKDGTSAFAAAALWHAIQYVAIVWLYNRRRYAGRRDPDAPLISWVSQPGRSFAYVGLIALCAGAVYTVAFAVSRVAHVAFEEFAMTLWTALTLGHYYLDGVIWKVKQYDLSTLGGGTAHKV
jgi:hypothetical protein